MLTVMSDMDRHTISWNLGFGMLSGLVRYVEVGFSRFWVDHGETL
jgi:hypothetical protein